MRGEIPLPLDIAVVVCILASVHPLLVEIPLFGGIRIYTYGVLVALAFLVSIFWTSREAKRIGINPNFVMDLSFYIILATLIGARLLYLLVEWRRYLENPLDIFKIWEGGLVFYGGLIVSILFSIFYSRHNGISFLKVADLFAPSIALGHGLGRLGCFFAGCCYGREAPHFFAAITFPATRFSLAPANTPLYPTQLMEMTTLLLLFGFLTWRSRRKKFDGQIFLLYIVLYSVARAFLETFRGDAIRGFLIPGWLSTSQFVSVILIVAAAVTYCRLRLQEKQ